MKFFSWTKSVSTKTFSLYYKNPTTFLSYISNKELKSKKIEVLYHNRIFEILKDQKVIIEKVKKTKIYFLPFKLPPFYCCFTLWSLLFQSCYSLTIIDKLVLNLVKRIQFKRKKV